MTVVEQAVANQLEVDELPWATFETPGKTQMKPPSVAPS